MAIMTMLLSEYANEPIDVLHTIGMLLIHDLVEIDAGDTYAYDEEGKKTQADRCLLYTSLEILDSGISISLMIRGAILLYKNISCLITEMEK